jgi:serine/threonine-protein kinase RsbW
MRLIVPSLKSQLSPLRAQLRELLSRRRLSESAVHDLVLAVHEAVVNAMVHGNRLDPERSVRLRIEFRAREVEVEVADEGGGFDWRGWLVRVQCEGVPPDSPSGRGIRVISCVMDRIAYNASGNVVHLTKRYDR